MFCFFLLNNIDGSLINDLKPLFNNFILPEMNYNARLLAKDIYKKKPELSIEPGYFVDMIPQYTMIVKEMDGKNFKDVKNVKRKHLVDRLILNEKRIKSIMDSINEISKFKR